MVQAFHGLKPWEVWRFRLEGFRLQGLECGWWRFGGQSFRPRGVQAEGVD